MSNKVSGLVYERAPFEDDRFHVLLALADSANDDGYSYGSLITIARKARVSYRNTVYSIKKLEASRTNNEKILTVNRHRKKGMSNDYYINVPLLEALPTYWPPALLSRVQPLHPSASVENSDSLGATVENLGCNRDENRVQPVHPNHDLYNHDLYNHEESHDLTDHDAVENFSGESGQAGLFDPSSIGDLVRFQTGATALPKGGRHCRNDADPGGWSTAEVATALKDILRRELHDGDRKSLVTLSTLGFSTELTIYLLWAVKRKNEKAIEKKASKAGAPAHGVYFSSSLQKLWADCQTAIRKAEDDSLRMTPLQLFWFNNSIVLKEINMWLHNLGRS